VLRLKSLFGVEQEFVGGADVTHMDEEFTNAADRIIVSGSKLLFIAVCGVVFIVMIVRQWLNSSVTAMTSLRKCSQQ